MTLPTSESTPRSQSSRGKNLSTADKILIIVSDATEIVDTLYPSCHSRRNSCSSPDNRNLGRFIRRCRASAGGEVRN